MSYFYPFGRCRHCTWPHHFRCDVRARRPRWWRKGRDAYSVAHCCNCGLRTLIEGDDR